MANPPVSNVTLAIHLALSAREDGKSRALRRIGDVRRAHVVQPKNKLLLTLSCFAVLLRLLLQRGGRQEAGRAGRAWTGPRAQMHIHNDAGKNKSRAEMLLARVEHT
jgi:hypothetical protein